MGRLSIEIEPEQHRQIKTLATFEGKTMKEFILSKTLPQNSQEAEMDTTEKLMSHPVNRERLMEAINAPRSESRIFETMDELRDAFGI